MGRLTVDQRTEALVLLKAGETHLSVASKLKCSQSTITRLAHKMEQTGTVADRPRSGRPKVSSPTDDHKLVMQCKRDPFQTANEIKRCACECDVYVSVCVLYACECTVSVRAVCTASVLCAL